MTEVLPAGELAVLHALFARALLTSRPTYIISPAISNKYLTDTRNSSVLVFVFMIEKTQSVRIRNCTGFKNYGKRISEVNR